MASGLARYFVGNELLASRPIQAAILPHSLAYCCAECGEVWARAWVEGRCWSFIQAPCEAHTWQGVLDWGAIPGSMITGSAASEAVWSLAGAIEFLPLEVLRRELEVHMQYFEKEMTSEQGPLDLRALQQV